MGSAIAVVCALGCTAMLGWGVRAEAKRKAQQRQQLARDDTDTTADDGDFEQWETDADWADWRGAP